MTYYAGLDVSLEETAICIVDAKGRIVREVRAASEPDALVSTLEALELPLERIGLEACSLTAWLHDGLRAAGLPAICIETRQANAAMKTMPNKTDRNDARALAQIMRTGWFRQVHVKSRPSRLQRLLLVARRTLAERNALDRKRGARRAARSWTEAALAWPGAVCGAGSRADRRGSSCHGHRRAAARGSRDNAGAARPAEEPGARHCPRGPDLPAADDCPGRRADHRAGLPGHHRRSGAFRETPRGRRPSRAHARALPVW